MRINKDALFFRLFQVSTFCVCLGRGLEHLFWGTPWRTFFWDESLLSPLVKFFTGMDWHPFVTHPLYNLMINGFEVLTGGFLISVAIFSLFQRSKKPHKIFLAAGSYLILFSLLLFKEKFYRYGLLFEYAAQVASPFLLYSWSRKTSLSPKFIFSLKLVVALTFFCHGLFAVGYYPIPGLFIDMTLDIFRLTEDQAKLFLLIMGTTDMIFAFCLFIPSLWKLAIPFGITWGLLTSLARSVSLINLDSIFQDWGLWTSETLFRLPHFFIPLALFFALRYFDIKKATA